jgi:hypothetical protein
MNFDATQLRGACVSAVVAAALLAGTAEASGAPPRGLPERALHHVHHPSKQTSGKPRRRPGRARAATFNTFFFGKTICPQIDPGGATLNSAQITPPFIIGGSGEWFRYWNGIATQGSNWNVVSWDGPYYAEGNTVKIWTYAGGTWRWDYGENHGIGTTNATWQRGMNALGYQHVEDLTTGEVRRGWTTAVNGVLFPGSAVCSLM